MEPRYHNHTEQDLQQTNFYIGLLFSRETNAKHLDKEGDKSSYKHTN